LFFASLSTRLTAFLKSFSLRVFLKALIASLVIFFLNLFIIVLLRSFLKAFLADLVTGMFKQFKIENLKNKI